MEGSELFEKSIILIGPSGVGKTTIGKELSIITGMKQINLDGIANSDRTRGITSKFPSRDDYKLYLFKKVIENAIETNSYGIVDFGAGYSVFDSKEKFIEAQELLGSFKNIVLLQYSDDIEESLNVINARSKGSTENNYRYITSDCNARLATMTIVTKDKMPDEIAKEIIEKIKENNKTI